MSRAFSPRVPAYLALGCAGLLGGLLVGRPEPAIAGSACLLALAVGLAAAARPRLSLRVSLERDRLLEGEPTQLRLELESGRPAAQVQIELALPAGVTAATRSVALSPRRGEKRSLAIEIRAQRWGSYRLPGVKLSARDRFGLFLYEAPIRPDLRLRVYPSPERIRRAVVPWESQVLAGNERSRQKGEGVEFADIRPFQPGDRVRRVNWRVSARRSQLHVNEMEPERNADVVVFLDTFVELGRAGESSLDVALRAAIALVDFYLERRDRVALVAFGGTLRWLRPAAGAIQRYRIVEALLETELAVSYAWKGIDIVPRRVLPAKALVLALTPLLDERAVGALLDLRGRGFDVVVLELSAPAFAQPGRGRGDELAYRLWELGRENLRARYREAGVTVAEWRPGTPLEAVLEEVRGYRRHARRRLA